MRELLPEKLQLLAKHCPAPLYVVGGSVRDYLGNLTPLSGKRDWDVCAPLPAETFEKIAKEHGFFIKAVYAHTGTVKLIDEESAEYEYTCFRSDKYVRGIHAPVEIYFTNDMGADAKRRDFTCNAVYYDIQAGKFCDPLGGIDDIKNKRMRTVAPAKKVFGEDGLRLMRLARQAATLGFFPDEDCLLGAKENSALIQDISAERIFAELSAILSADNAYGVSGAHYRGISLLNEIGVLDYVLPELTLGRNMAQRPDFHKYDVLEHSLRAVLYAPPKLRFAALLHDIGKPFCQLRDGNSHAHPQEGETLTRAILTRLKAPKKFTDVTARLVELHMYDFNCQTRENKLRKFFVGNYSILEDLLLLKQADFSACTDNLSIAPTRARWQALLEKMQEENAPFTLKELAVSGNDLLALSIPPASISKTLNALLIHAALHPKDNEKTQLLKLALALQKTV